MNLAGLSCDAAHQDYPRKCKLSMRGNVSTGKCKAFLHFQTQARDDTITEIYAYTVGEFVSDLPN